MIEKLSITVRSFLIGVLKSLSVDGILLSRYMNVSTNFWGLPPKVDMTHFSLKKHELYFLSINVDAIPFYCLSQAMYPGLWLDWCIYEKQYIIGVHCIFHCFCGILSNYWGRKDVFMPFWKAIIEDLILYHRFHFLPR